MRIQHRFYATVLAVIVFGVFTAGADSVTISGVDNSRLLIDQTVGVYVSVTDGRGSPITDLAKEDFDIFEAVPGGPEAPREILDFRQGINMSQGINMFLLLDNSGSMYEDARGNEIEDVNRQPFTYARIAVKNLLQDIKNPADRVGVAAFNVKVGNTIKPTKDIVAAEKALSQISRPGEGEGYTELYESLYASVEIVRNTAGRKVIVLLSDGENYPLQDNPNISERRGLEKSIEFAQKEGISIFCIGLGNADRQELTHIASATGGAFRYANSPQELSDLYSLIRTQVLNEYWMTFKGGMEPSVKKEVRVSTRGADTTREYYSDTMFGLPHEPMNLLFLLMIPIALLLLWLLSRMKFEKKQDLPSLQVLSGPGKGGGAFTIAEGKNQVTIGGGKTADLTIVGDPAVTMMEATVTRKGDVFTIAGDEIKVNNRTVKTKVLTAGDVIAVGDTTVVFDDNFAKTVVGGSGTGRKGAPKKSTSGRSSVKKSSGGGTKKSSGTKKSGSGSRSSKSSTGKRSPSSSSRGKSTGKSTSTKKKS